MAYAAFIALLVVYTFFLKKKFGMRFFEAWTSEKISSKPILYLMPTIPVCLSALTVFFLLYLKSL